MFKYWGIKHSVLLLALAPAITISLILGGYFTSLRLEELSSALNDRGTAVVSRLAAQAEYGMSVIDPESLRMLGQRELNNEISSVIFYNKTGMQIASAGIQSTAQIILPANNLDTVHIRLNEKYDTISFIKPIIFRDVVGWIKIEVERKVTRLKEYQLLLHSALIMLLGFVISGLFASRLGSKVTEPILALTRAIELIKQGKLDTRVNINAKWELAILESGVNTMASSLHIAHKELQKNIAQATADLRNTLETIELQNIELDLSRKEAEAASKVKSEFLASMSHELRTPLNGIIGFINLLQKLDLTERQRDYINTIQKSANSLLSIINDILDFSKIEAGKLHLDIEPMNLYECVEDALTLLAPSAHEKGLELVPFIYNDVPIQILGDSLRITQIITNLVSNAIKFTYTGSVIVRVMLDDETTTNVTLHISVQDTGIGMTEEQQKKLFNAFNQLDPKITKKFGGSGLGLVICKKLLEQMQGNIDLESVPNQGSTFWFSLTVDKFAEIPSVDAELKFNNIKILLFESHPITRISIRHLLEKWGFHVQEVENYHSIPQIVKTAYLAGAPFQLTIIGVNQLDLAGDFISNIFNAIRHQYACAIGVIANTTDHIIHGEILRAGVTLCLAKPICRQKFYAALSDVFDQQIPTNLLHKNPLITTNIEPEKIKILVVDDNSENLKLAVALLEAIGTDVTTANSGQSALLVTRDTLFNLILMDIHMPVIDGIDTSKTIRTSGNINKNTPIVALSANILLSEKSAIRKAKINGYLTKPINENQLRAAIYKWTHSGTSNHDIIRSSIKHYNKTSTRANQNTKLKSIDLKLAKKLAAGNMEMAKDMLDMLVQTLPKEKQLINANYIAGNRDILHEVIHKLHGACCYTGTPKLKQQLQILESSLESATLSSLEAHIQQLNLEIDRVISLWQAEIIIN